tara:strand:+ start:646 stop:909 length:264 start_codon:yes stop_codon:yes gene_type:complete
VSSFKIYYNILIQNQYVSEGVDTFHGNKDTIPPQKGVSYLSVSILFFGPFIVLIGEGYSKTQNTTKLMFGTDYLLLGRPEKLRLEKL